MRKKSKHRDAIMDILHSDISHPTAEEIFDVLREDFPNVSPATVYRNLKKLEDAGEVREILTGDSSHFDGDVSEHYHFICNRCGAIIDVMPQRDMPEIDTLEEKGFEVENYALTIYGVCGKCREAEKLEKASCNCV